MNTYHALITKVTLQGNKLTFFYITTFKCLLSTETHYVNPMKILFLSYMKRASPETVCVKKLKNERKVL
jgi:hypothetical protein